MGNIFSNMSEFAFVLVFFSTDHAKGGQARDQLIFSQPCD